MSEADQPASSRQLVAVERQRRIALLARQQGYVRGRTLAEMFGVTEETIRRDLMQLAEAGVVRRSHGGAVSSTRETTLDRRLRENEPAKAAIARVASSLIEDGSTIVIDSGSTTIHLARSLGDKEDLVVVTNAVTHAVEMIENPRVTVLLTGGVVRRPTFGAAGELAVSTLRELTVDQTFLAISSVSVSRGLMYPDYEEVAVKRAMIAAADQVILLADHTKFTSRALVQVAPITAVSCIVTDDGLDEEIAEEIRETGVDLIIADTTQERARGADQSRSASTDPTPSNH